MLAPNGSAALEMLHAGDFDLVLTDVRMPGMNGLELLAEVVRTRPAVGVLMLTACEDLTLAVNAMRIGALDYILKPFRLSEITVSVQEALDRLVDGGAAEDPDPQARHVERGQPGREQQQPDDDPPDAGRVQCRCG